MPNKPRARSIRVTALTTFIQKSMGLIGKHSVSPVTFSTRWGLHTFGMCVPIDVLILDDDGHVVSLAQYLHPNRFFFWNPKYIRVVELPAGYIRQKHIAIGDTLLLRTAQ